VASPRSTTGCDAALSKMKRPGPPYLRSVRRAAVVGYYALAVGAVASAEAPGRVRRNMPDPVPVMVLADLLSMKIGREEDRAGAAPRCRSAHIARRGNCQHPRDSSAPISERARKFYEDCGFVASPMDPMTLMITVAEAVKAFVGKSNPL